MYTLQRHYYRIFGLNGVHLPDTDALIRDEVGLVCAIAVKVLHIQNLL
jgi:hypothetical protein